MLGFELGMYHIIICGRINVFTVKIIEYRKYSIIYIKEINNYIITHTNVINCPLCQGHFELV